MGYRFKLSEVMKDKGVTIKQLHESTGVSTNTIGLIRSNRSKGIQLATLWKFCTFLECGIEDLIVREDENKYLKARILDREKITNITFYKKENGEILSDEYSASLIINWVGDVYELMGNGKGDYELLYEGDWIGYRIEVKQDK